MGLSLLLYWLLYRGNGIVTTYQTILERNFHLLLLFFQETVQMFRSNAVPALSPAFPKVPEHHFRPECFLNHICKIRWCLMNVTGTLWAHKPQKSIDVLHREVLRLIFFFPGENQFETLGDARIPRMLKNYRSLRRKEMTEVWNLLFCATRLVLCAIRLGVSSGKQPLRQRCFSGIAKGNSPSTEKGYCWKLSPAVLYLCGLLHFKWCEPPVDSFFF